MTRWLLALLGLAWGISASPILAQDPEAILEARRAGLIGERYDGYLGLASAAVPVEVRRQVSAVNIRRRTLYANLAARRRVSPAEVGITAACSLLRRISVGEYYLPARGGWRRLEQGQSPVPDYCV